MNMADHDMVDNGVYGSPGSEGSNDVGRRKEIKSDRSRRSWSDREEATLIIALKDLVAHGWKADNGFRAGYLTRIEEVMRREFPNTNLKVHPHLQSKVTTWKKQYYSFSVILSRSGVGFNVNGDFKIDCDDEEWAQIVQKDGNARYMRNKAWPHWESWKEIYGKDRAKGVRAAEAIEVVNKNFATNNNVNCDGSGDYPMTFDELFPNELLGEDLPAGVLPHGVVPERVELEPEEESRCNNETNSPKLTKKEIKKRKVADPMERVVELIDRMQKDTSEHLKTLTTRIGYEFDLSTKRAEVFDMVGDIPGLTLKQKFHASKKLVKEPELMDLFRGLPEVARPAFVLDLLELDGFL